MTFSYLNKWKFLLSHLQLHLRLCMCVLSLTFTFTSVSRCLILFILFISLCFLNIKIHNFNQLGNFFKHYFFKLYLFCIFSFLSFWRPWLYVSCLSSTLLLSSFIPIFINFYWFLRIYPRFSHQVSCQWSLASYSITSFPFLKILFGSIKLAWSFPNHSFLGF